MPEEIKEKKDGLVVKEIKDDMPEASFEGEFYKPSQYSVEGIDRGWVGDFAGQIPGFATGQTYADAAVNFATDLKEKGFEESTKDAFEFIQEDAAGPGLGNKVTRVINRAVIGGAKVLTDQTLANDQQIKDGGAKVFFGGSIPEMPVEGPVEGFASNALRIYLAWRFLRPASKAFSTFQTGKKILDSPAGTYIKPIAKRIIDGANSKQGNLSQLENLLPEGMKGLARNGRLPRWVPGVGWQRWQSVGVKGLGKAVEGAPFGMGVDYGLLEKIATGERDPDTGNWITYNGLPSFLDFQKISPDDTFHEAGMKQLVEGAVLWGPASNTLVPAIKSSWSWTKYSQVWGRNFKARIMKGAVDAKAKGQPTVESDIKEAKEGSQTAIRRLKVRKVLPAETYDQPELLDTPEVQMILKEVYEVEKIANDPAKADSIIKAAPTDKELGETFNDVVEDLDNLRQQVELDQISTPETAGKYRFELTEDIDVQPEIMQFKTAGVLNKSGVSGELLIKAPEFDQKLAGPIQVWRNPETNRLTVVNGHNRLWLAKKSGRMDIAIEEISARDVADARTQGAIRNIAEGHGESVDIAKLMRDASITPEDLAAKYNLDVGTAKTTAGIELSRLPSELFNKVISGDLISARGAALGSIEGLDDSIIREIARDGSSWTETKIRGAMKIATDAIVTDGEEGFLKDLGMSVKNSDFKKRAAVHQYARNVLKDDIRTLKASAKGGRKKTVIEGVPGNAVNVEGSREALDEAAILSQRFDEVALNKGPVKTILDEIVENMKGAGDATAKRAVDKRLEDLQAAIKQEIYKPQKIEDPWKPSVRENPRAKSTVEKASDEILEQVEEIQAKESIEEPLTQRKHEGLLDEDLKELASKSRKDLLSEKQIQNRNIKIQKLETIEPAKLTQKERRELSRAKRELVKDVEARSYADEMDIRVIEPPKVSMPVETAITKVPKKTLVSKFLRMAPREDQAAIALNRVLEAMDKFSDGVKKNKGPIDTVGDLINFLNIARVTAEEAVQKALRDWNDVIIYLQQPRTKLFPGEKAYLREKRMERAAKIIKDKGDLDPRIKALGPEPSEPKPLIGSGRSQKTFVLPNELGRMKPAYGMASLNFESELDQVAYIIRNKKTKSKAEDRIIAALTKQGYNPTEVKAHGAVVHKALKEAMVEKTGSASASPDNSAGVSLTIPNQKFKVDSEAVQKWDKQKEKYEFYWNERNAIEEELGLIKSDETRIEKAAEDNPNGSLSSNIPEFLRKQNANNGFSNKNIFSSEDQQDLVENLNLAKHWKRVAGDSKIEFRKDISGTYSADQAAAMGAKPGAEFDGFGMYAPTEVTGALDDIVYIAAYMRGKKLDFRTREFTILHEAFHRLQWRYLTPGELNTLLEFDDEIRAFAADVVQSMELSSEYAKQLLDGTISSNEAQAIAFSGWGEFGSLVKKKTWATPFKKLAEIIKNAQRWLDNKSYTTFDEIFEQAYKGEILERGQVKSSYDAALSKKIVERQRGGQGIVPNGQLMAVDNNSKVPFEGDEDFAKRFADILEQNKDKIARGETTPAKLWGENIFQKTQSQSGKYVYNHRSENLLEGLDAMGRAEPGATRAGLTGASTFDGIQVQKDSHKWFEERGANGGEILGGLESLAKGFYGHEVGALYRAMDFADKLQLRAQIEADIWRSAATNPKVDQRVQLARLVRSADSARRMHLAIMNITRRWGQLGQEMQLPRDIDTYQIPDDYKLPTRGESVVRQALEQELAPIEGMADLATKFKGLREALEIGQVDLDAKVAADEIADSVLISSANPRGATGAWKRFDGEISKAENPIKGMQLARSANLINGGLTTSKAIINGIFNMGLLTIEQSVGGAISRDYGRSLYSLQMFGGYINNLQTGFRNAAIAFKTGRPLGNLDRSSLDVLGKVADGDAQGELFSNKTDRTGWTINTMDMEKQWAETLPGKIQNGLWQVLGSSGARLAVTIDSFNSTVGGWTYEFFRHMPRGMELAVEAGHKKFSKEAFDEAYKYAEKRVDNAVRSAVVDGKNMTEVALDSPHAKYFQDAVNFTENILPAMEARTMSDGLERGRAKGLDGEELTQYATDWVKKGDWVQRVANGMTNDWAVNPGRWGSIPGVVLTESADFPVVGAGIRFVQPFMRVATNIFKSSLRRGFVPGTPIPTSIFVDSWWRDVASADPGTRQRAMGEVAVAAGAAQLLALGTNMGFVRINGAGPEDYNARQKWIADRQMTHSLQVWDDDINYWSAPVSLAAFEPYTTVFGYIGDYNDTQARMTDDERNKSAAALTFELMQLQLSGTIKKSYFSGINDFYEAALDKNKVLYGSTNRISRFTGWLQRTLASTVPLNAPVKQMRMQLDPTRRKVEPDLNGGLGGYFNEQFAATKMNIPGYSKENPAILDWSAPGAPPVEAPSLFFTKNMAENYPWASAFMQYVPIIGAFPKGKQVTDPVKQEMYTLHGKGTSFLGPTASDFGRPDLYLTPGELNKYKEIFATVTDINGLTWHQRTTQLIDGSFYRSLPDETPSSKFASKKAAAIQLLITEYKGYAKEIFENTVPKGVQVKEAREELERRNLETEVMMQNKGNASQFNQKVNY